MNDTTFPKLVLQTSHNLDFLLGLPRHEGCDKVTDPERTFVGEHFHFICPAFERSRQEQDGAQPALRRPFKEPGIQPQQLPGILFLNGFDH